MARNIRIKIKDAEKLIFSIDEDAHKGDYFNLNSVNEISLEEIKNILSVKENEYKNEIRKIEKQVWTNEFMNSSEYQALIKKNYQQEEQIKQFEKLMNTEIEKKSLELKQEMKEEYNNKIKELENQISQSNNDLSKFKDLKVQEDKIKELESNNKHKEEIDKQAKKFDDQISELKRQLDFSERSKNSNVKLLGEELENWIVTECSNHFGCSDDVSIEKTTKDVNGTKPDFKFSIWNVEKKIELTTVIIEGKTQFKNSKTKNKDHYDKLNSDRNKMYGEIALLVTELEPENNFSIRKINEHKDMYEVRPAYLIIFLSLIRMMALAHKQIKELELNFRDKQDILKEFEDMKNEILNNSIKHIDTKIKEIKNQAEKIRDYSNKIISNVELILDSHLKTVETKLRDFRIQKITKLIDKKNYQTDETFLIEEKIIKE